MMARRINIALALAARVYLVQNQQTIADA